MIKYIDLFAGIGGIRLGASNALLEYGIESQCVLSSEIDDNACETYKLNFNEYPSGDVRNIKDIPLFDLLLGGFPCQPFSYAGKRKGFGDTRGTLFFEIERILRDNQPKAFLLENVRGLYTHDGGRTFETIMSKLHELGYGTYDLILNSSNFGVPQNRVRLYILGIKGATPKMSLKTNYGPSDSHSYKNSRNDLTGSFSPSLKHKCTVGEVLESTVPLKYYCSATFESQLRSVIGDDLSKLNGYRLIDYRGGQSLHSWELGKKGKCSAAEIKFMNLLIQNRRKPVFGTQQDGKKLTLEQIKSFYTDDDISEVMASLISKRYLKEENGKYNPVCGNMSFEVFKFLDPESISITLTSSDSSRLGVIQNNHARRITPRECARLQGFPDSFIVNPTDTFAYKQFGNSVSVPVIEAVLSDFIEQNIDILGWK
ncbi:MAG: DNA (cytosine-5-)-methyltransferase [Bacillota bacterium]|nr:DNA (cytosine-5-)-methyltransferase [Bacillota bacterium]